MIFVIDCHIPYLRGVLESQGHECRYLEPEEINASTVRHADCLMIRTRTRCNSTLLDNSAVRCIATATIGYDHIDVDYCHSNGISVISAPGCNATAVEQYVDAAIRTWLKKRHINKLPIVGIVGVGHVGTLVAKRWQDYGAQVLCCDPPRERAESLTDFKDIKQLAENCDVITLHTPLTHHCEHATYHIVSDEILDIFSGNNKLLINAARGGVLDEESAIRHTNIDYIIDCWEHEPDINKTMLQHCFIGTPHIAGYSAQGKANATTMIVRQINKLYNLGLENWAAPYQRSRTISDYDIMADDRALRDAPNDFEKLRSNYKFRE